MNKQLMSGAISKCLGWFYKNYFSVVYQMKNCTQSYDFKNPQPWHMEDDVWTHTLLAVNSLKMEPFINDFFYDSDLSGLPKLNYDMVVMVVMLHDIGKFKARQVSFQNRCRFFNHEALNHQEIYEICLHFGFTDSEILSILLAINSHSYYYQHQNIDNTFKRLNRSSEALRLLIILSKADESGQIRDIQTVKAVSKGDKIDAHTEMVEYFFSDHDEPNTNKADFKFVFLSGIPACGKDWTIDRLMCDNDKQKKYSLDQIRLDLYRETFPNHDLNSVDEFEAAYQFTQNKNLKHMMVLRMFKDRETTDTFYISNTLTTPKSRRHIIASIKQAFRKYEVEFSCIQKFVPLDIIHERDERRGMDGGKTVGEKVVMNMSNLIQVATMSEGFSDIKHIMRGS